MRTLSLLTHIRTPLMSAAFRGHEDILELLLDHPDVKVNLVRKYLIASLQ